LLPFEPVAATVEAFDPLLELPPPLPVELPLVAFVEPLLAGPTLWVPPREVGKAVAPSRLEQPKTATATKAAARHSATRRKRIETSQLARDNTK